MVRYVSDRFFVPTDIFDKGRFLDDGGTAVRLLHMFPYLTGDSRIGKAYGAFSLEEPPPRAEAERIQVAVIRFPDKEPAASHACRRQAFEKLIVAFFRDFLESRLSARV